MKFSHVESALLHLKFLFYYFNDGGCYWYIILHSYLHFYFSTITVYM